MTITYRLRFPEARFTGRTGAFLPVAPGHPMILGVKLRAFAHLLANGRFSTFLVRAVLDFRATRWRDRLTSVTRSAVRIADSSPRQ